MDNTLQPRRLSILIGISYWIIFFAAIFANFFAIEALIDDPINTVQHNHLLVRAGILAFLITVIFDVIVAWALYELFKQHVLTVLSTLFRMMHAIIMAVAIFALPFTLNATSSEEILNSVAVFNNIWLIGLFFFGMHLILLARIIKRPVFIVIFLTIAGIMYMLDTSAHFMLADYEDYSAIFLLLVAVPSIFGEMSLALWLLIKGGKQ